MEYVTSVFDSPQDLPGALARFWDVAGMYQTQFTGFNSPSWDPNRPDTAAQGVFKNTSVFFEGWERDDDKTCKLRLLVKSEDLDQSALNVILGELTALVNPRAAHRFDAADLRTDGFTYHSSWRGCYGEHGPNSSLEFTQARDGEHAALRDQDGEVVVTWEDRAIGLGAANSNRQEVYYLYPHFRSNFSEPLEISPGPGKPPCAIDDIRGARTLPIRREVKALAVSPDGAFLAVYEVNREFGEGGRIAIIDLEAGSRRLVTTLERGYERTLNFSPDGTWLLLGSSWPEVVNVEEGWSASLKGVTGPACWWIRDGATVLLQIGEFDPMGQPIDPGRMVLHDLGSGERSELGSVNFPNRPDAAKGRELSAPIAGRNGKVLVGIHWDVDEAHIEEFGRADRVAVLDPATGDMFSVVGPFADSEHQVERVNHAWSWNSPLRSNEPTVISDDLLERRISASADDDEPEEYAYWNLLALRVDSPLLTGDWDA